MIMFFLTNSLYTTFSHCKVYFDQFKLNFAQEKTTTVQSTKMLPSSLTTELQNVALSCNAEMTEHKNTFVREGSIL